MRAYWWNAKKNWGDLLTPLLLNKLAGIESTWAPPEKAEIVAVGSVLEHLPTDYSGIIAGAGALFPNSAIHLPKAHVLALRGELSAACIPGDYVLGDPGFLAPDIATPILSDPVFAAAAQLAGLPANDRTILVPHWSDTELIHRFDGAEVVFADWPPDVAIQTIANAQRVISSSLHGCIVAASFGIPFWAELPPTGASVGVSPFKWFDAFGPKFEFGKWQVGNQARIAEAQKGLRDVFAELQRSPTSS